MLSTGVIRTIARARVRDAQVLLSEDRYDGAFYLCGYAVELASKARICRTLKWQGFPESSSEFKDLSSFKTHNLNVLLKLSGRDNKIRTDATLFAAWSIVLQWQPETRYRPIGQATQQEASDMITSSQTLLRAL
jgi:hypothetical protein